MTGSVTTGRPVSQQGAPAEVVVVVGVTSPPTPPPVDAAVGNGEVAFVGPIPPPPPPPPIDDEDDEAVPVGEMAPDG